jgi:hypothetical protein
MSALTLSTLWRTGTVPAVFENRHSKFYLVPERKERILRSCELSRIENGKSFRWEQVLYEYLTAILGDVYTGTVRTAGREVQGKDVSQLKFILLK